MKKIAVISILPLLFSAVLAASEPVAQASGEAGEIRKKVVQEQGEEPPLFVVRMNGKAGFVDERGKLVIPPTFQAAYPFKEGLAAVQVGNLWGFIDAKGDMVIQPQFTQTAFFSEGLAPFRKPYRQLWGAWGYINRKGEVVIEPSFDTTGDFCGGVARVGLETRRGKLLSFVADARLVPMDYRFIDRSGAYVDDPGPARFATGEPGELILFKKDGRWGFCDADRQVVIEPKFAAALKFSEGLACARLGDLYGFIDKTGEFAIKPQFPYPNSFSDGLAGVPLGDQGWGFIDKVGKVVIEPKFGWIYGGFRHGLAEVAMDGQQAYVDKTGQIVWPTKE